MADGRSPRRRRFPALRALLAAFVIAEVYFRFGAGLGQPPVAKPDPDIEYLLKPDAAYRRHGARIAVNAHGMRAADFEARRAADEWRVMLVGDGVVFGGGHVDARGGLDQDATVAARLTSLLDARQPACRAVVGAIAAPGWGPVNQLAYVDRFGLFGADAVVVVASAEDLDDYPTHARANPPLRLQPPYLAVVDAADAAVRARLAAAVDAPATPSLSARRIRARSAAALGRIVAKAQIMGADASVLFHPGSDEFAAGASSAFADDARAAFARAADAQSAPFVDLAGVYEAAVDAPSALYTDGRLLNEAGAETMARAIANHLDERRAPDCAGRDIANRL
ncbi:MAG: hypothetical protein ACFB00_08400 [Parvularculaceae bacterium]